MAKLTTLAELKVINATKKGLQTEFNIQGSLTNKFLYESGIHQWLYEDAQKQREEHLGKARDYVKAKSDIKPPTKALEARLKHWKTVTKPSHDRMVKRLQTSNKVSGDIGGQQALGIMGVKMNFDLKDPKLLGQLMARGTKITGIVDQNTLYDIQRTITYSYYELGQDVREVARDIKGLFEETYRNRSLVIAKTEVATSQLGIQWETFNKNGLDRKVWMARNDGKTRPSHLRNAEMGIVDMDYVYPNGLRYPYDPLGEAGEIINCRCTWKPIFDKKEIPSNVWSGGK